MGRMEHRCGIRRAFAANVTLRPCGLVAVPGRIRNASISGMFVEADAGLFADNSVIEVEATLPGTSSLRTFRWQALVVRRTEGGIGLMFDHLRPPAISRLLEISDVTGSGLPAIPPGAGRERPPALGQ